MSTTMSSFSLLSILATLPLISAQGTDFCATGRYLYTQADISQVAQCTRFTDYLAIDRNLHGEAIIAGPQYIKSFYAGNPFASHSTPTLGPTYVEVIGLPDAVEVGDLRIAGADYLRELRVPKLQTISGGLQVDNTVIKSLDFPSLQRIDGYTYFTGIFDTINLSALKTAYTISITTTGSLDCIALFAQLKNIKWTVPELDSKSVPTFRCTSSLNSYTTPLGFPYIPIPDVTTSSTVVTTTLISTSSANGTAITTYTAPPTTITTQATILPTNGAGGSGNGGSGSGTGNGSGGNGGGVLPGGNNGTGVVTSKSTVKGPVPTASPTQLQSNDGNMLRLGSWTGVIALFAVGLGL